MEGSVIYIWPVIIFWMGGETSPRIRKTIVALIKAFEGYHDLKKNVHKRVLITQTAQTTGQTLCDVTYGVFEDFFRDSVQNMQALFSDGGWHNWFCEMFHWALMCAVPQCPPQKRVSSCFCSHPLQFVFIPSAVLDDLFSDFFSIPL